MDRAVRGRLVSVRGVTVGVGLVAVLALSACTVTPAGSPIVSKGTVESTVASKLEAQTGATVKSVSCPGDLEAEVGATQRCVLTAGDGSMLGVVVTVSNVAGEKVDFDIQADTIVTPAP